MAQWHHITPIEPQARCNWHPNCTLALNHVYQEDAHTHARNQTETDLINLFNELDEGILSGNPQHPNILRLMAPNFRAQHDKYSPTETMDVYDFMDFVRHLQATYFADAGLEVAESWVDLAAPSSKDPEVESATVWQLVRVDRYKDGIVQHSLIHAKWQRRRDDPESNWLCYYTSTLISAPLVNGQMGPCY